MKMNEKGRLNGRVLEQVTGGTWSFDTITPAELKKYNALQEAWEEAEMEQNWEVQGRLEKKINAFIDRMDAKYGA